MYGGGARPVKAGSGPRGPGLAACRPCQRAAGFHSRQNALGDFAIASASARGRPPRRSRARRPDRRSAGPGRRLHRRQPVGARAGSPWALPSTCTKRPPGPPRRQGGGATPALAMDPCDDEIGHAAPGRVRGERRLHGLAVIVVADERMDGRCDGADRRFVSREDADRFRNVGQGPGRIRPACRNRRRRARGGRRSRRGARGLGGRIVPPPSTRVPSRA